MDSGKNSTRNINFTAIEKYAERGMIIKGDLIVI